jgi:hypothetical protein
VLNGAKPGDTTISFVAQARPGKLFRVLREEYGYRVRGWRPGIYHVEGDLFAAQIVESKRLEGEGGGIWLRELRRGLQREELRAIMELSGKLPEGVPLRAYLDVLLRANARKYEEMIAMADTLEAVLEKHGLIAKWEERGLQKGLEKGLQKGLQKGLEKGLERGRKQEREQAVRNLRKYGMDPGRIAEALELPADTVYRYLDAE